MSGTLSVYSNVSASFASSSGLIGLRFAGSPAARTVDISLD
jgi:hypothetical protein